MKQNVKSLMGISVKAMIFHDGKLLLLQKNDAEILHHWEFPGGGLGPKEDFLTGLRREVMEETGLDIHVMAPVGVWSYEKKNGQFLNGLIFAAVADTGIVRLSDEHVDYHWILPQEVPKYRLHGSLWRSLLEMKEFDYIKSQRLLCEFLTACRRKNE